METMAVAQQIGDVNTLWKQFHKFPTQKTKEKIVLHYLQLVKYVVDRMFMHLPQNVSRDDLQNAGVLGLIKAIDRFDPERQVKFETFAIHRIRGAIIDELRTYDLMPRRLRVKARELQHVIDSLEGELKRAPNEVEIAKRMGLPMDAYHKLVRELSPIHFFPISDTLNDEGEWKVYKEINSSLTDTLGVDTIAERIEAKNTLMKSIQALPKQERIVVALYYYEELTMKEIGVVLKVSESRVSQIHTQAILRLRNAIEKILGPN